MGTHSEVIDLIESTLRLLKAWGYELKADGEDLDLHDEDGWIATVGAIEVY